MPSQASEAAAPPAVAMKKCGLASDPSQEKFNWHLVTPTFHKPKPNQDLDTFRACGSAAFSQSAKR